MRTSCETRRRSSWRWIWIATQHEETGGVEHLREHRYPLRDAEADGTLHYVASTYSRDNDAISDGISRPGPRVVTFAPILKHNIFPLAQLLDCTAKAGRRSPGSSRGD